MEYQIGNTKIDERGDSPVFEITLDRWKFQQMLDLGFSETSQNLNNFYFLHFIGGTKEKTKQKLLTSLFYLSSYFLFDIPFLDYSVNLFSLSLKNTTKNN